MYRGMWCFFYHLQCLRCSDWLILFSQCSPVNWECWESHHNKYQRVSPSPSLPLSYIFLIAFSHTVRHIFLSNFLSSLTISNLDILSRAFYFHPHLIHIEFTSKSKHRMLYFLPCINHTVIWGNNKDHISANISDSWKSHSPRLSEKEFLHFIQDENICIYIR